MDSKIFICTININMSVTLISNRYSIFVVTSTSECILCKCKWLVFYYYSSG